MVTCFDNRRAANSDQVSRLTALAMKNKPSVDFSGALLNKKAS